MIILTDEDNLFVNEPMQGEQALECAQRLRNCLNQIRNQEPFYGIAQEFAEMIITISNYLFPGCDSQNTLDDQIRNGSIPRYLTTFVSAVTEFGNEINEDLRVSNRMFSRARMVRNQRSRGLKPLSNDCKDIFSYFDSRAVSGKNTNVLRCVAELFDLCVFHPLIERLERQPDHILRQVEPLVASLSLQLNDLARNCRACDANHRYVFHLLYHCTTEHEKTLLFRRQDSNTNDSNESSRSSSSCSNRSVGNTSTRSTIGRTRSASAVSELIPDIIQEHRCENYGQDNHECETAACVDDKRGVVCDVTTVPIVQNVQGGIEQESNDMPKRRNGRIPTSEIMFLDDESPIAQKSLPDFQDFRIAENSMFGTAAPRKRSDAAMNTAQQAVDGSLKGHLPSQSMPGSVIGERISSRPRENTV